MAQRALLEDMKTSGSWSAWLERQPGYKSANDYYNGQGLSDTRVPPKGSL